MTTTQRVHVGATAALAVVWSLQLFVHDQPGWLRAVWAAAVLGQMALTIFLLRKYRAEARQSRVDAQG